MPTPFNPGEALCRADEILSRPPARPHIVRPAPVGARVWRCALPLELLQPQNRTRHGARWELGKLKAEVWIRMLAQHGLPVRQLPLPGRPQVLCTRFSAAEPDRYADWAKAAVDALCLPSGRRKRGLGLLRDDRPKDVDLHQWWEPGPRGAGFGVIEVRIEVREGEP